MNSFKERDFFHEGMRNFQNIFDGQRIPEATEKIENITNFGMKKKRLLKVQTFSL